MARKRSYNPNSQILLNKLESIHNMSFFKRNCRKFENGSMRVAIITWVRMTMGIGGFAVPFFIKKLGALVGFFFILCAGIINYNTFVYIFQASEYTGI